MEGSREVLLSKIRIIITIIKHSGGPQGVCSLPGGPWA
jgi:hypothetical protein